MSTIIPDIKAIAQNTRIAYTALVDSRTPLLARLILLFAVAYFLSPIDLVPDFIPVLGVMDEAILIPILVKLSFRVIPDDLMREFQKRVETKPVRSRYFSIAGMIIVVSVWVVLILLITAILI